MSNATIVDNDLLKNEIKALNDYVNRDEYNLKVVEVMVNEIQDIVRGLKPCEKAEPTINPIATCPYCGSKNVQYMYGMAKASNKQVLHLSCHYICNDCHEEFENDK